VPRDRTPVDGDHDEYAGYVWLTVTSERAVVGPADSPGGECIAARRQLSMQPCGAIGEALSREIGLVHLINAAPACDDSLRSKLPRRPYAIFYTKVHDRLMRPCWLPTYRRPHHHCERPCNSPIFTSLNASAKPGCHQPQPEKSKPLSASWQPRAARCCATG
jgi:hypothetical protein